MKLTELEKAIRAAMRGNSMQPALVTLAGSSQENIHLPAEFDAATKSLMERLQEKADRNDTGRVAGLDWI